jgi:glycosyltransferase involved in cell wall biosynthesis
MSADTIRLLAILEARSITGPARNLLDFCRFARELQGRHVETSIVTWRRPDQRGGDEFLDAAGTAGIEVEVIEEQSAFDRQGVAALRRIVQRRDPDVLQTHAVKSHFLLRVSGLARSKPWVAFHHGYTFQDFRMRAYNLLDRWSLRVPSRVVTMNQVFARHLAARGVPADRIKVLHNAIESAWLTQGSVTRDQARRDLGIGSDRPLVIAVGRLSREKAFDCLLEALANLRDALLLLVGDGPERSKLARQAARLGLEDRVRLVGQIREVRPFYAAADVVAISSVTEGSPNVLLEAMAARVPVVATTVGGIPEIVRHEESALLVRPGDPEGLASALARTIADRSEAKVRAGRAAELIRKRHSPQARARRLVEMYSELAPA